MMAACRSAVVAFAWMLCALAAPPAHAAEEAVRLERAEIRSLLGDAQDSTRAADALIRCRAWLAGGLDATQVSVIRKALLSALITLRAPLVEIAAGADTLITLTPGPTRAGTAIELAADLSRHPHARPLAPVYARQGLERLPPGRAAAGPRGQAEMVLAVDCLSRDLADSAIIHLARAIPDRADSQAVLAQLGATCAQSHREREAIGYWVRAAAVFGGPDTSVAPPLRALYAQQYGSLEGLDARMDAARKAARRQVALEGPRVDEPAPDWTLKDLDGKPVSLGSLKGQVVVLNFWGTWCGPCRMELPHFENLYRRYHGKKVAFLSVDVELGGSEAEHVERARSFIEQNHYSFPVLPDHDGVAVQAHNIDSYPTVLVIDPTGRIRYRNIGYREVFDDIIADQLATMVK